MNGNVQCRLSELELHLKRGPSGLGFNIVGGTDQQYISNDSGIFVTKIREDGTAAEDGRLEEGDKILAINGRELTNLTHQEAVSLFRSAGEDVTLRVLKREQIQMNGPIGNRGSGESGSTPVALIFIAVTAVAVAAVLGYMRYRHRI